MKVEKTFLTESQEKVLKLRSEGLSQSEIAEKLGTTRSNICSLEKRAEKNIKKAENTVYLSKKIRSPIKMTITRNEDVLNSAERLFSKANEAHIHVNSDTPSLISKIRDEAGQKLEGRRAIEKIELFITPEGEVIVS